MRRNLIVAASVGSAALLIGAFAFQYIGGLAPCALCLEQRYPHAAALLVGLAAIWFKGRVLPVLGAAAMAVTAGLGVYHTGVERGFWEGPTTCTSGPIGALSADELFNQIMAAPLVRCDDVAWSFIGLSMASWNAVLSVILMAIWISAARRG